MTNHVALSGSLRSNAIAASPAAPHSATAAQRATRTDFLTFLRFLPLRRRAEQRQWMQIVENALHILDEAAVARGSRFHHAANDPGADAFPFLFAAWPAQRFPP